MLLGSLSANYHRAAAFLNPARDPFPEKASNDISCEQQAYPQTHGKERF